MLISYTVASAKGGRRRRYRAASVASPSTTSDAVPAELTGAAKWTTVKIADSTKPTMDSIFLGADQVSLLPLCPFACFVMSVHISVHSCLSSCLLLSYYYAGYETENRDAKHTLSVAYYEIHSCYS